TVFPSPWNHRKYTNAFTTIVDGGYFRTLGISVLAGRAFTDLDRTQGEGRAVIDTLAARQLFGTTQVLGREFHFGANNTRPGSLFKVIGVVRTIRHSAVAQAQHIGSIYVDRSQVLGLNNTWWSQNQWMVAVRTPLPASRILPLVRNAVAAALPGIPIYDIRTLKQRLDSHLAYRRGLAVLVAFFSLSALLLAAVGLYAVQSYTVSQRTREFGTRSALGADRLALLRLVLTEAGRLLVIGLILGLAGMVIIGQIFASALYGVSPLDPVTALIVLGVLAVTLSLAAWIPAWRASRVAPAVALRHE
ncbi:MAG: FtsX-like permease family protein, partial [Gammaproteobacteria bacterium]